jgi:hypothetical protein
MKLKAPQLINYFAGLRFPQTRHQKPGHVLMNIVLDTNLKKAQAVREVQALNPLDFVMILEDKP